LQQLSVLLKPVTVYLFNSSVCSVHC